jgi:hypothetical protein
MKGVATIAGIALAPATGGISSLPLEAAAVAARPNEDEE